MPDADNIETAASQIQMPREPDAKPRPRRLRRFLACLLFIYLAWCGIIYFYQDRLLFPREYAPPAPASAPPGVQVLSIATEDGKVEGLLWTNPSGSPPQPVVIFCHGNAEIADYEDRIVQAYRRLGCAVFVPEYRGYGRSNGRPSQRAIVADLVQLYDDLIGRSDIDRSRIAIHGRSLGGGVAAQLAARRPPGALILESTFTSVAAFGWRYGVPPFIAKNPFHTDDLVGSFHFPVLIFHGSSDPVIPVSHGRRLHALIASSRYVEYAADHNGFPGEQNEQAYWHEIASFLRTAQLIP